MVSHRRSYAWVWITLVLVAALTVAGGATWMLTQRLHSRTRQVMLNYDGYSISIKTFDTTVADILARYDIQLGPGDEVTPDINEALEDETNITIKRAMAVDVTADGKTTTVYLTGGTVKDFLDKAGVTLREQDLINIPLDTVVKPRDSIVVTRIDEDLLVETESIPYKVVTKKNNDLEEGLTRVIHEGKEGVLERRIKVVYRDGEEVSRMVVSETVVKQPQDRVVEKGTAKYVTIASRGTREKYTTAMTMRATAYTAGYESTGKKPGDRYYGITASGKKVQPYHTIAAPKSIPFGTRVYIPELVEFWKKRGVSISGIFVVEDRGGAIKGNRIDIYMEDESTTKVWGVRYVTVYILD